MDNFTRILPLWGEDINLIFLEYRKLATTHVQHRCVYWPFLLYIQWLWLNIKVSNLLVRSGVLLKIQLNFKLQKPVGHLFLYPFITVYRGRARVECFGTSCKVLPSNSRIEQYFHRNLYWYIISANHLERPKSTFLGLSFKIKFQTVAETM